MGRPCTFVCVWTGTLERLEVDKKAEVEVEQEKEKTREKLHA